MSGRPQTYVGSLEDRVVEAQAIAHELASAHDPWEWAALRTLQQSVEQLVANLADGYIDHALADAEAMARVVRELIARDLVENQKHREIAGARVRQGEAA